MKGLAPKRSLLPIGFTPRPFAFSAAFASKTPLSEKGRRVFRRFPFSSSEARKP